MGAPKRGRKFYSASDRSLRVREMKGVANRHLDGLSRRRAWRWTGDSEVVNRRSLMVCVRAGLSASLPWSCDVFMPKAKMEYTSSDTVN